MVTRNFGKQTASIDHQFSGKFTIHPKIPSIIGLVGQFRGYPWIPSYFMDFNGNKNMGKTG